MPTLKRIYIYRESHLPENGWLQACFRCKAITGKYILFETFHHNEYLYEFYIHTCSRCKRKFDDSPLLFVNFSDECNDYIRDHFDHLFPG